MSFKDWEQEIVNSYPDIFSEYEDRSWGFESPEGWKNILTEFCEKLSKSDSKVKIKSMKEKWGQLVVDTSPRHFSSIPPSMGNPEWTSVSLAELEDSISWVVGKSGETCSYCGGIGELRKGGFWQVLCNSCYENEEVRKNKGY